MFNRGTFFKGEFGPSKRPLPFFDFLGPFFFVPIPIVLSPGQFPRNGGGGLYVPIPGAPFPPFLLPDFGGLVLLPIRGAPFPVIFFIASIASGTPIDPSKVPKKPPDCALVGLTTTCPPVCNADTICFFSVRQSASLCTE